MIWNMNREDFLRNPENYHKIADDNVNVYKVGYVIENSFYDGSVFCPYIPHVTESYSIKHLKEKTGLYLDEDICQNNLYLRNGYLSYSEELIFKPDGKIINFYPKEKKNDGCIDRLFQERCLIRIYDKFVIAKFILPKGTEYYKNDYGFIMSSTLMWTGDFQLVSELECGKLFNLSELCVGV